MDGQHVLKLSDRSEDSDKAKPTHPTSNTTSTKGNLHVGFFKLYLQILSRYTQRQI